METMGPQMRDDVDGRRSVLDKETMDEGLNNKVKDNDNRYPPEWRLLKNGEIRTVPTPYEETLEKCLTTYSRAGKGTYEPPK